MKVALRAGGENCHVVGLPREKLRLGAGAGVVGLLYESQKWWHGRGRVHASVRPLAVRRPSRGMARLAAVVAISGNGRGMRIWVLG